jgi:lipopolysaccharide export system permease protein
MFKTTIKRYLFREVFQAFIVAFMFFFFIFVVNVLLLKAEDIFSKNVPFEDVFLIILYSIPKYMIFTIPFGTLVGSLMAMGRLNADNEILALRASGISIFKIFVPIFILGLMLSVISFVFNDYFVPLGNIHFKTLIKKITLSNPGIELEPYTIKKYENTSIITGNVKDNAISDIVIIDLDEQNKKRFISAKNAYLETNEQERGIISLRLEDVVSHVTDIEARDYSEYSTAETMIYNLLLRDINVDMINPGPAEMSSLDVLKEIETKQDALNVREEERDRIVKKLKYSLAMEIRSLREETRDMPFIPPARLNNLKNMYINIQNEKTRPIEDNKLQRFKMEFHKKFSMSFACVVFIIFAFAVGLVSRKGRFIGFGIGVVMAAIYWVLLFVSYRMGSKLSFSAFFSMWMPNLVVLFIGSVFFVIKAKQ